MATQRTLLISGSLSDRAVRSYLRAAKAGSMDVVEMDTLHDRSLYPGIGQWLDFISLVPYAEACDITQTADDVIDLFLSFETPDTTIPTHRAFRAASLSARAKRMAAPYLTNLHIAQQALKSKNFDRLVVAAGSGINFAAWQECAQMHQIPITLLPVEKTPISLRRRAWKAWHRWRKPNSVRLESPLPGHDGTSRVTESILCTSERIARLLAKESVTQNLPILTLTTAETTASDTHEVEENARRYRQWWQRWLEEVTTRGGHLATQPGTQAILRSLGEEAVSNSYPGHALIYKLAKTRLENLQPRLLLCDTQIGTTERMWSLAAQELGIPVLAYVYDQIPNPRFSFSPDYVLSDASRATLMCQQRGIPKESIIEVRSHRQSRLPTAEKPPVGKRPIILYADTYYSGICATLDPSISFRCYRQIVETARQLPHLDFAIKFHPLREKKQEALSFVGLDEQELVHIKRFIRELNPPANLHLIEPEISMIEQLKQATVLLNLNSTAAHEAFQMGVPVVFLQTPRAESMAFMRIHEFSCMSAEDSDTLVKSLQQLTTNAHLRSTQIDNQKRYLQEIYWSSERTITDGIRECLSQVLI